MVSHQKNPMNIAIVYDTITEFGGAERVLQALLHVFPNAHIYTLIADANVIRTHFPSLPKNHIHTHPWLSDIVKTHTSLLQAVSPFLWRYFNFAEYDVVLSTPAHLMSNLIRVPTIHVQYIHSLPKNLFHILPPTPLQRLLRYDSYCAPLYKRALQSTPYILTNSRHMQRTIYEHTGTHATVIHPPIMVPHHLSRAHKHASYYLYVGRLDTQKHIELAIMACTALSEALFIVGVSNEPRYEQYLRSIAGPTVTFMGHRTDDEIHALYRGAKAVLFPSKNEDFGISPVESMAHGVPVIAYFGGGAKETIVDGVTGVFFRRHTPKSLIAAIRRFQSLSFRKQTLIMHASQYTLERFRHRCLTYVQGIQKKKRV